MSITAIPTASGLAKALQAGGLSTAKTQIVENDLNDAIKTTSGSGGGSANASAVRAALNKKIADDVASGKLSKADAATVTKALDAIDQQAGGTASANARPAAAPAGGGAHAGGGGGGGGGSTTKTELSRTVTVSGALETTTILYTDGTSETTTSIATGSAADTKSQDKATGDTDSSSAYLSTVEPGTLFELQA